ncbi:TRAM domain-containing protein [Halostagnicola kamekurae]|uniref:Predicted RNA-binding protein, contains TRAM domain n=1 Tax=Halostagnicola kamekurae TaxID=619731 RepID=A0A1I6TP14_9EURY|nr:TRAM domain-containing protein [Halostagnicola kamekurae]SFS90963.1 Predicted RNA-binding protein, contains TRAM domain [Halostagnicola kamekurae]
MDIPDELLCVFSAEVTEQQDSYRIEVPKNEVEVGDVTTDDVYRVALLASASNADTTSSTGSATQSSRSSDRGGPEPPVESGEQRTVDIEDIGEQGDGIARIERGYVVIVPDAEKGERVTIEIDDVTETVAFAEVVDRKEYYE